MTEAEKLIRDIVLARLDVMPENVGLSIGGGGKFSREELIVHVTKNDDIGKKMIKIQLAYLQSLKGLTNELVNDSYASCYPA